MEMIPAAAWFRVSTGHQETDNQVPDVEQFAPHHGYEIDPRYRYTITVVSVKEPWLNGSREVQDVLVAFAGWMAERESARRSDRIKNGLARRRAEGKPVGRQRGAVDKKQRRRAGYVASWEDGPRRVAQQARTEEDPS